jgi:hypothetical protein
MSRSALDVLRSVRRYMADSLGSEWEVRLESEAGNVNFPFCEVVRAAPTTIGGSAHLVENSLILSIRCIKGVDFDTVKAARFAAYEVEEQLWQIFRRGGGRLTPPASVSATDAGAGGLAAGTYSYVVTTRARSGETTASAAAEITVDADSAVNLAWPMIGGATGYRVYRDGYLIANVRGATTVTFRDVGVTANTNTSPPEANTTVSGAPMRIPLYDFTGVGPAQDVTDSGNRPRPDFLRVSALSINPLPDPDDERVISVVTSCTVQWNRDGLMPSLDGAIATSVDITVTGS